MRAILRTPVWEVMLVEARCKDHEDCDWRQGTSVDIVDFFVPLRASSTLIEPPEAAASPAISTSSAAGTGDVGSSPSDYDILVSIFLHTVECSELQAINNTAAQVLMRYC
jgi:hypothetical protein